LSTVPRESKCVDEADVDACIGMNFTSESSTPAVLAGDQNDDFEVEVVIAVGGG